MKIIRRHGWQVGTAEAIELQKKLVSEVIHTGCIGTVRYIAGVDISVNRWAKTGTAAVVVLGFPDLEIVEVKTVTNKIDFPYVPGLLTFREAPLILDAFEILDYEPDIVMVDGQGIAHPRRIGLAAHLGLFLDIPTIGVAKSRLCGTGKEPGNTPGDYEYLMDGEEIIGVVLRTRAGVKPLYISIGHKIDLADSIRTVMECCRGYRLPEPTRLAHQAAGGNLKLKNGRAAVKAG